MFVLAAGHHGGEAVASHGHYGLPAFLQGFIDSQAGATLAVFFHAAGYIVFIAALGFAFIAALAPRPLTRRELVRLRIAAWAGLGMNLVGGLMRLAQSDHPTLASLGTDAWVQIILVKHLLWVVLAASAYVLLHRLLPKLVDPAPEAGVAARARKSTLQSIGLVLLIAVAGAAAVTIGPGSHDMEPAPAEPVPPTIRLVNQTLDLPYNGTLTGLPARPAAQALPFTVPANGTLLTATLSWPDATAKLQLRLGNPQGAITLGTTTGTQATVRVTQPMAGTWRLIVYSDQSVQEPYAGAIHIQYLGPEPTHEH